jgi:hypothetical protein
MGVVWRKVIFLYGQTITLNLFELGRDARVEEVFRDSHCWKFREKVSLVYYIHPKTQGSQMGKEMLSRRVSALANNFLRTGASSSSAIGRLGPGFLFCRALRRAIMCNVFTFADYYKFYTSSRSLGFVFIARSRHRRRRRRLRRLSLC